MCWNKKYDELFSRILQLSYSDKIKNFVANKITNALMEQKCSYGRAAKIISVYLKTSLVIPNKGINCEYIHPPLDRELICNLIKLNKLNDYKYNFCNYQSWKKYFDKYQ
jgi:hypothetical protein